MITSDMDGTLLTGGNWDERRLPLDFEEVLERLESLGIHFLAASGRTYPSVRANFGKLADRIDYICDNGGCLVHGGKVVHIEEIVPELAEKLNRLVQTQRLGQLSCCSEKGTYLLGGVSWLGSVREQQWIYSLTDFHALTEPISKMTVRIPSQLDVFAVRQQLEDVLGDGLNFVVSGREIIDVMKRGVDKGSGLRYFQKMWGIDREECMSFGDQYNDFGQFEASGWSFAMANAADEIKAKARFVADTNDHDGVTRAIRTYVFGEKEALS